MLPELYTISCLNISHFADREWNSSEREDTGLEKKQNIVHLEKLDGLTSGCLSEIIGIVTKSNYPKAIPLLTFMISLCILGSLGNLVVILIYQKKTPKTTGNFYMLVLAWLDLWGCVLLHPYAIFKIISPFRQEWTVVCKLWEFMIHANFSCSICTLTAIAVDRYLAICRTFSFKRSQRISYIMAGIALASGFLGSLPLLEFYGSLNFIFVYKSAGVTVPCIICDHSNYYRGSVQVMSYSWSELTMFVLTLTVISSSYIRITIKLNTTSSVGASVPQASITLPTVSETTMEKVAVKNEAKMAYRRWKSAVFPTSGHSQQIPQEDKLTSPETQTSGRRLSRQSLEKQTYTRRLSRQTSVRHLCRQPLDVETSWRTLSGQLKTQTFGKSSLNQPLNTETFDGNSTGQPLEAQACRGSSSQQPPEAQTSRQPLDAETSERSSSMQLLDAKTPEGSSSRQPLDAQTSERSSSRQPLGPKTSEGSSLRQRPGYQWRRKRKNAVKVSLMLFTVTSAFLLSWLPLFLVKFGVMLDDEYSLDARPVRGFFLHTFYINNVINPIIYLIFQQQFREDTSNLLKSIFKKTYWCC